MNKSEYNDIMVFVEQRDGQIANGSLELLSKARELAQEIDCKVKALLPGFGFNEETAYLMSCYGADVSYIINDPKLQDYRTEPYTKVICNFIEKHKPEIVLISASVIGRDCAPRISARLHTGLTADCTELEIDPEQKQLLMTRPALGGNILATIVCPEHRPQMSTVRPGVMKKVMSDIRKPLLIEYLIADLDEEDCNTEILETVKEGHQKKHIEEASILISAGRGIGHADHLNALEELAKSLGGELSGSRAVIDAGWLDHCQQVGQTGKTVRPEVYFACGISGAIQHVAGMEESELIIAINKSPEAPIFEYADLGIITDVNKLIPLLNNQLKKQANL